MASFIIWNCSRLEGNVTVELQNWVSSFSSNSFILLATVILFGNSLVVASHNINRRLRTQANAFLVSLALSDFLVGSISMPMWIYIIIVVILCMHVGVFSEARSLLQHNPHHLSAGRQSKGIIGQYYRGERKIWRHRRDSEPLYLIPFIVK